ncbi:MAG: hypothetical protein SFU91_03200 [Chloroherpetonaceae bacterium]|nr:hypothetical protein [Chloroherpetonaceae bacterium]
MNAISRDKELFNCIYTLSFENERKLSIVSTSFLLTFESPKEYLLVTTAHTVDDLENCKWGVDNGFGKISTFYKTKRPALGRDYDRADLAFALMDEKTKIFFENNNFRFISSFDIGEINDHEYLGYYTISGFPGSQNKNLNFRTNYHSWHFKHDVNNEFIELNQKFYNSHHFENFYLPYNLKVATETGKSAVLPKFEGMSGSPIWGWFKKGDKIIPKWIGMLISYLPKEKYFFATSSGKTLFILNDYLNFNDNYSIQRKQIL